MPKQKRPSKARGKTVAEALYPQAPEELVRLAKVWCAGSSALILESIWRGYDALRGDAAVTSYLANATDDMERGLTRFLEPRIRAQLTGFEPFYVQHGVPEDESRKPRGRPREYDIAFIFRDNPRVMWSVEAKLLPTSTVPPDYVRTLNERYLACEYAPFVAESAMAAYLLSGTANLALASLATALGTKLVRPKRWANRSHRVSAHRRTVPPGKCYPVRFRCHHLLMPF